MIFAIAFVKNKKSRPLFRGRLAVTER